MVAERVVAFGFLTAGDLEVLGSEFNRHFAIENDDLFVELIAKLDRIEIEPVEHGIIVRTGRP